MAFLETAKTFLTAPQTETCQECGYPWSTPLEEARALISSAPARYASLVGSRDAKRKPAPAAWSPSAYVWHVSDALHAWAERFWAIRHDPGSAIVPFDQDRLGAVRGYEALSTVAGLWSLERSVADWDLALEGADPGIALEHPEFGAGTIGDVVRWIRHEVHHHDLDIRRGLGIA